MSDSVSGKTDLLYVQLERSNNLLESNVTVSSSQYIVRL